MCYHKENHIESHEDYGYVEAIHKWHANIRSNLWKINDFISRQ